MNHPAEPTPIHTHLLGQSLTFHTTWGLFSPKKIDEGTELLLTHVPTILTKTNQTAPKQVLDIGCGYGPIGLSLAKAYPQSHVTLVDTNIVAIEYTQKNADTNNIHNAQIQASNGLKHITGTYDLIISNIPAKIGKELTKAFIVDSYTQLNEEGLLVFVAVNGLRETLKRELKATFGTYKKYKQGTHYVLIGAQKSATL